MIGVSCGTRSYLAAAALLAVLGACGADDRLLHEIAGATMGTVYSVKIVGLDDKVDRERLRKDIDAVLAIIESHMSTYRSDSELSQFNATTSLDWMPVSAHTHAVMAEAQRISALTGGAFDVTVGPLVNLWGFGPDGLRDAPPSPGEVARERTRVGYRQVMLRDAPPALRKARDDVYVDLSAIAKGYAVDRVAALLDAAGIKNYLVEVGGELCARGHNAHGGRWKIAIERPSAGTRSVQRLVPIADKAMATSGDYRNFFESGGRRYSHSIDPRTGAPVDHALASVTVIGESAMFADAMATALTILGPENGYELAEREEIAALFISRNGDGFSERSTNTFDNLGAMQ